MKRVILASQSPRRRELMADSGIPFLARASHTEEFLDLSLPITQAIEHIAYEKASALKSTYPEDVIIGADTVVYYQNQVLGKPKDHEDAFRMLKSLQGASHMVYTGGAVVDAATKETLVNFTDGTRVSMYSMTEEWIRDYIETGEPMDKAGAYAIQGGCSLWIKGIEGAYSTVVGFPTARFYHELRKIGVDLLERSAERKTMGI